MLAALAADPSVGLGSVEAARRLKEFGPNQLQTHPPVTAAMILLNQLKGPVVWLLASAAAIAGLFAEWTEAIAILLVLGINTAIGFFTELRAVRSMEALRSDGGRVGIARAARRRPRRPRRPSSWCPATSSSWTPATWSAPICG